MAIENTQMEIKCGKCGVKKTITVYVDEGGDVKHWETITDICREGWETLYTPKEVREYNILRMYDRVVLPIWKHHCPKCRQYNEEPEP